MPPQCHLYTACGVSIQHWTGEWKNIIALFSQRNSKESHSLCTYFCRKEMLITLVMSRCMQTLEKEEKPDLICFVSFTTGATCMASLINQRLYVSSDVLKDTPPEQEAHCTWLLAFVGRTGPQITHSWYTSACGYCGGKSCITSCLNRVEVPTWEELCKAHWADLLCDPNSAKLRRP